MTHSGSLAATWGDKGEWQLGLEMAPGQRGEVNLMLHTAVSLAGTLMAYDDSPHAAVVVLAADRDLNYSEPARITLRVVPPLYRNAAIVLPSAAGMLGLLGILTFSIVRLMIRPRKARQLQVQLLENERQRNVFLE